MALGRPTKYDPKYCEEIIEFMSDGSSLVGFAAHIRVDDSTLYEWAKVHPEFSRAKKIALKQSQAWWEKQGRKGLFNGRGESFSQSVWIFNMKARFGYRDVQQVETTVSIDKAFDTKKMSKEEYKEFVAAQLKKKSDD